jgi:hypothetical protein
MSDAESSSGGHGRTRRQFLKVADVAGVAGALGVAGWTGQVLYLHGENERTSTETVDPVRSSHAGPSTADVPAGRLLSVIDQYSADRSNVGLQACAIFGDGTQWRGVAGNADHDDEVPLSFAHHLYIGSVTKLYTATLVLKQVQQGVLSLSDTIDEWVDLDYTSDVTLRMLLNHTSGVPNYTSEAWFLARYLGLPNRTWDPSELLTVIRGAELQFEPGARHEYSNSNYVLLGIILATVTGRPYGKLVRRLVREDAGFDRTYYLDYPGDARIANAYDESIFDLGRRNLTGFRELLQTGPTRLAESSRLHRTSPASFEHCSPATCWPHRWLPRCEPSSMHPTRTSRLSVATDSVFGTSPSTASNSSAILGRFPATPPLRCTTTIPSTPSRSSATSRLSTKRTYSIDSSKSCWMASTDGQRFSPG